jgi:serine protease
MGNRAAIALLAASILVIGGLAPMASASLPINQADQKKSVAGLIVKYSEGVLAAARNGQPTAANRIPVPVLSKALGDGYYALSFESDVTAAVASDWAKALQTDLRVQSVDLDHRLVASSTAAVLSSPIVFSRLQKASSPRSLKATRSTSANDPTIARLRLNWTRPASLYGGTIVGYRVQISTNGGRTYKNVIKNTRSDETRAFISEGLEAGASYRFRVSAITNDGGKNVVGTYSSAITASPRTTPRPVALTKQFRTGPGPVNFIVQNLADRGGFAKKALSYYGVATSIETGESIDSGSCSATRCRFPDLESGVRYQVEVFATNPRGETSSKASVLVRDEFFSAQWHLKGDYGVSMPQAWHFSKGKSSVVVAVIDSGITAHPELLPNLTKRANGNIYGYDFVSDPDISQDGDGRDNDPSDVGGWHGTHVSGIIAAKADTVGITGAAPNVKILPIRALGPEGGVTSDLVASIRWAAGYKVAGVPDNQFRAKVINLSLGSEEPANCTNALQNAIDGATSRGISVVTAAGNSSDRARDYLPGNCSGVINVAATNSSGDLASYSNYGQGVTISAPGGDDSSVYFDALDTSGLIVSTFLDDADSPSYGLAGGTSMAAPVVSGVVALMYSMKPNLTTTQIRNLLSKSTKPFAENGICDLESLCGPGILNAHLALARVGALK